MKYLLQPQDNIYALSHAIYKMYAERQSQLLYLSSTNLCIYKLVYFCPSSSLCVMRVSVWLMWSMLGTLEWGQGMVFPALCVADVVHAGHPGMGAGHGLSSFVCCWCGPCWAPWNGGRAWSFRVCVLLMWSMLGTLEWGQGMVFPALCVASVVCWAPWNGGRAWSFPELSVLCVASRGVYYGCAHMCLQHLYILLHYMYLICSMYLISSIVL